MRKIREILRLTWLHKIGARQTARSCGISHSTVKEYVRRATAAGLTWPAVEALSAEEVERRLFESVTSPRPTRPLPGWEEIHAELKRRGVTRQLLWEEYRIRHPEGYSYSRFCELYQAWAGKLDVSMRQSHKAGEKLFVDYSGQTMSVSCNGEVRTAEIFVAVLGASNYTYAEATWSQRLPDWIGSHVRAFEFFGGVTQLVVPDNLRSAVSKACRYEPDLNPTYNDLASHYATAVIPARVRKPQDKSKAEGGVLEVQRRILAPLRNRTFLSLGELNTAIRELLGPLNARPFQKMEGTRRSLFESLDRPALQPLPAEPYEYAEWSKTRVRPDYHVRLEEHDYSVPYQLVGEELDVRQTQHMVVFLFKDRPVAIHRRCRGRGHTTLRGHMPAQHAQYADWDPPRLIAWSEKIGPATAQTARAMLSRAHPHQGFHSCLGLVSLARRYDAPRLEAACRRAVAIGGTTYKSLRSILEKGLDRQALSEDTPPPADPITHENIRGASYYAATTTDEEVTLC